MAVHVTHTSLVTCAVTGYRVCTLLVYCCRGNDSGSETDSSELVTGRHCLRMEPMVMAIDYLISGSNPSTWWLPSLSGIFVESGGILRGSSCTMSALTGLSGQPGDKRGNASQGITRGEKIRVSASAVTFT